MSILGLANVSSWAHWILLSDDGSKVLAVESWTSEETKDISSGYAQSLEKVLIENSLDRAQISRIYILTGPGSFTGLRNAAAFARGLTSSLGIPLIPLPCFDLYGQNFFIPARHQLAKNLSKEEALKTKLEFIHVQSPQLSEVSPISPQAKIVGLSDEPDWPQPQDFQRAIRLHIKKGKIPEPSEIIELQYGMEPKISGQRKEQ